MAAAVCRRGGCSKPADPASPGGEWCAECGWEVRKGRLVASASMITADGRPKQQAYHKQPRRR